jgi:hypothetical protein
MPLEGPKKLGEIGIEWDKFLVSVDDVNLVDKNINTVMGNTAPLDTCWKNGLKVNQEKIMYMFMSHHQNMKNHNIKATNRTTENTAVFKRSGIAKTRNYVQICRHRKHAGYLLLNLPSFLTCPGYDTIF